jgi:AraC-like DNA-binding protein
MFRRLHQDLGGNLTLDHDEHTLEIDNELGKGQIRGISFVGGISYLEFNMEFNENFNFITNTTDNSPIYFAYCSRGKLKHSFGLNGKKHKLNNFQTGILTSRKNEDHVVYFEKDIPLKATLITVNTNSEDSEIQKNNLNKKLTETFFKGKEKENFVYIGSYNLKIAERIQQLNSIKQKGLVRNLLIEGDVHTILALELQQHSEDMANMKKNTGSLRAKELEAIKELSQFIRNYPDTQLLIKQLSRRSGLSPTKLQEGFKLMHGRTVTDYIREVRIQKSEELIKHTDLNISEVVYSIGFTSRSYFSKIFKKKYNCSPKQYKDNQNKVAVTA